MKNLFYAALILFLTSSLNMQAQSSFEKDMTTLHKDVFKTCGMIKSKTGHDDAKTLESLAALKNEIGSLQKKYMAKRPENYANDPMFGFYFFKLKDVVDNLSERVKRSDYKSATMNCSQFCMTFNMMHTINGTLDLTDMMFMWKMQITMTNNMYNASNLKGADHNIKRIPKIYEKVEALKVKKGNTDFNKEFSKLEEQYKSWLKAFRSHDFELATKYYKEFDAAFPKVFKDSL